MGARIGLSLRWRKLESRICVQLKLVPFPMSAKRVSVIVVLGDEPLDLGDCPKEVVELQFFPRCGIYWMFSTF